MNFNEMRDFVEKSTRVVQQGLGVHSRVEIERARASIESIKVLALIQLAQESNEIRHILEEMAVR